MENFSPILDLNATCVCCQYSIPPGEFDLVAPGVLRCPKCKRVFLAQKGGPVPGRNEGA
jgi:hypothetical protein